MRRWLANALLAGIGLAVGLGLAEAALRIAGVGYPSFYIPDRLRGAAHRPGAEGWFRREGESYVRINSAGLRDREHERPKPPGRFRIAFLGDSFAEAMPVDAGQAFWAVAERSLTKCPALTGREVEAINFGVSGYGTAQEIETLRHEVWDYEPDLVVLAFLTGNDLRNNMRELEGDPMRPYFVVRDGQLVLDDSFLVSPEWRRTQTWWWRTKNAAIAKLRTLQVIHEARNALLRNRLEAGEHEAERLIYQPPQDEIWTQAWDVTERMLRLLRDEVAARGARFELLILSNWRQVHPNPKVRAQEAESLGIANLRYPDRRLVAFANSEGIDVLNVVDPLAAAAESSGLCLHGFANAIPCGGHWNAEGHRLGGERLAERLCQQLETQARKQSAEALGRRAASRDRRDEGDRAEKL